MASAGERIKEARERDEARAEEQDVQGPTFEAPEPQPEPETPPTVPDEEEEEAASEPQPEGALTAEQADQLEKATAAYYKRIEKAFGADKVPPTCPSCNGLGFDVSGGSGEPDYLHASDKETCDECAGFGGVRSGSKVPGQDVVMCERCKGAGYLVTRQVRVQNAEQVAPVVVQLAEGGANSERAAMVKPGDPGWEPWMGGEPVAAGQ